MSPMRRMFQEPWLGESPFQKNLRTPPGQATLTSQSLFQTEDWLSRMSLGDLATKLSAKEEVQFQDWYRQKAPGLGLDPNPDDPKHYYDYRGFWKAEQEGRAGTSQDPFDRRVHFPDEWKLPGHPTYPDFEGRYRQEIAQEPQWQGFKSLWETGDNPVEKAYQKYKIIRTIMDPEQVPRSIELIKEFMTRPGEAVMGGIEAAIEDEPVLDAMAKGFLGTKHTEGRDILKAAGVPIDDPDWILEHPLQHFLWEATGATIEFVTDPIIWAFWFRPGIVKGVKALPPVKKMILKRQATAFAKVLREDLMPGRGPLTVDNFIKMMTDPKYAKYRDTPIYKEWISSFVHSAEQAATAKAAGAKVTDLVLFGGAPPLPGPSESKYFGIIARAGSKIPTLGSSEYSKYLEKLTPQERELEGQRAASTKQETDMLFGPEETQKIRQMDLYWQKLAVVDTSGITGSDAQKMAMESAKKAFLSEQAKVPPPKQLEWSLGPSDIKGQQYLEMEPTAEKPAVEPVKEPPTPRETVMARQTKNIEEEITYTGKRPDDMDVDLYIYNKTKRSHIANDRERIKTFNRLLEESAPGSYQAIINNKPTVPPEKLATRIVDLDNQIQDLEPLATAEYDGAKEWLTSAEADMTQEESIVKRVVEKGGIKYGQAVKDHGNWKQYPLVAKRKDGLSFDEMAAELKMTTDALDEGLSGYSAKSLRGAADEDIRDLIAEDPEGFPKYTTRDELMMERDRLEDIMLGMKLKVPAPPDDAPLRESDVRIQPEIKAGKKQPIRRPTPEPDVSQPVRKIIDDFALDDKAIHKVWVRELAELRKAVRHQLRFGDQFEPPPKITAEDHAILDELRGYKRGEEGQLKIPYHPTRTYKEIVDSGAKTGPGIQTDLTKEVVGLTKKQQKIFAKELSQAEQMWLDVIPPEDRPIDIKPWRPVPGHDVGALARVRGQYEFFSDYEGRALRKGGNIPISSEGIRPIVRASKKSRDQGVVLGAIAKQIFRGIKLEARVKIGKAMQGKKVALNPIETEALRNIRNHYRFLAKEFGIPPERMIEHYMPRVLEAFSTGDVTKIPIDQKAFFKYRRVGKLKQIIPDPLEVTLIYHHAGLRDKYLYESKLIPNFVKHIQELPFGIQSHAKDYIVRRILMRPTPWDIRVANDFNKVPGWGKLMKKLNTDTLTATRHISRAMAKVIHAAGLAGRLASGGKNLMQQSHNLAILGPEAFMHGILNAPKKPERELIRALGILRNYGIELERHGAEMTVSIPQKILDAGMVVFRGADSGSRRVATAGTRWLVEKHWKRYKAKEITLAQFYKKSLYSLLPYGARPEARAFIEAGDVEGYRNLLAEEFTGLGQYWYDPENMPLIFAGNLGRLSSVFATWPIFFGEMLYRFAKTGNWSRILQYYIAAMLFQQGLREAGIEVNPYGWADIQVGSHRISLIPGGWFLFGATPTSPTPFIQMMWTGARMAAVFLDGASDRMLKEVIRDFLRSTKMLEPYGLAAGDFVQGVEEILSGVYGKRDKDGDLMYISDLAEVIKRMASFPTVEEAEKRYRAPIWKFGQEEGYQERRIKRPTQERRLVPRGQEAPATGSWWETH